MITRTMDHAYQWLVEAGSEGRSLSDHDRPAFVKLATLKALVKQGLARQNDRGLWVRTSTEEQIR